MLGSNQGWLHARPTYHRLCYRSNSRTESERPALGERFFTQERQEQGLGCCTLEDGFSESGDLGCIGLGDKQRQFGIVLSRV